eukprot:937348-Pelagomonas_calceolata.AAC.1
MEMPHNRASCPEDHIFLQKDQLCGVNVFRTPLPMHMKYWFLSELEDCKDMYSAPFSPSLSNMTLLVNLNRLKDTDSYGL